MPSNFRQEERIGDCPRLFELCEQGHLTASTRILRADNGSDVPLGTLFSSGEQPLVWSVDGEMRMVARPLTEVVPAGRKQVRRVRLASGRQVEGTDHLGLSTIDGWVPIRDLEVGTRVAIPRWVPEPANTAAMPDPEVVLLAHMIGDGSCVRRQPIRYASIDEENLAAVTAAATHFGITAVRDEYAAARVTTLRLPAPYRLTHGKRNPIAAWLDDLGLFGLRSYEKFVPEPVFALPNQKVALFLNHLWSTDGSVHWNPKGRQGRIYYASTSRRLIDDVAQLLLRLDIHGRIKVVSKSGYRDCWHLNIDGVDNQLTFIDDIGVNGARGRSAAALRTELEPITSNTNVDTVPKQVWDRVRRQLAAKGTSHRDFQAAMGTRFCGATMWKHAPSRHRLEKASRILEDGDLWAVATSDLFWDRIVEISDLGEQEVYGCLVAGMPSLVAQGTFVLGLPAVCCRMV
ncbi:LAGLIDADG family homing endonuclease [Nocardia tengchongensis]|uniref:LAGLIDADG family homing endonuclease n=1 Tax=Nocardia tengchongensis TaxID=2055889 RepID=UPI00360794F2